MMVLVINTNEHAMAEYITCCLKIIHLKVQNDLLHEKFEDEGQCGKQRVDGIGVVG